MKKLDFLILVENVKRGELDNACLLSAELKHRGYSIAIDYFRRPWKYFYNPSVVIVPNCYADSEVINYAAFYRKKKIKIVNLQYEQVLSKQYEDSKMYSISGQAKNVAFITWGEASKARLLDKGIKEKNIFVTGSIGLDYYSKPLSGMLKPKAEIAKEFSIPVNAKWNLFASNFAHTNKTVLEDAMKRVPDVDLNLQSDIACKTKALLVDYLNKALALYPDQIFIYRPHPSELEDERLIKLSKAYRNFFVISDYSLKQWISCCDTIGIYYSTSIVDAYFAKKDTYIFRPVSMDTTLDSVMLLGAEHITNYDEFTAFFQGQNGGRFPISEDKIFLHYGHPDYKAYSRVADVCEKVLAEDSYTVFYKNVKKSEYSRLKNFLVLVLQEINCHIPIYDLFKRKKHVRTQFKMDYDQFRYIQKNKADIEKVILNLIHNKDRH